MFLVLARDPASTLSQRAADRLSAATLFEAVDDKDRAVTQYRGVVDEFANTEDAGARAVAEKARVALERLAKGAAPGK